MTPQRIALTLSLTLAGLTLASGASATPILVDFTDGVWSGAQGQTSYSVNYGSVDVTLGTASSHLTFNASDAPAPGSGYDFLALAGDGIGIGDDEIGADEALGVAFSSGVKILGFYLLDLFASEGPGGEQGTVSFLTPGGVVDHSVFATALGGAGFYALDGLDIDGVTGIALTSLFSFSDYALAGILFDDGIVSLTKTAKVPEPNMLPLLATGLLCLGFAFARRRGTV